MTKKGVILADIMLWEAIGSPKWEPLHDVIERLGPEASNSLVIAEHTGGILRSGHITFEEAVTVAWL
jgi:hypothetical protein